MKITLCGIIISLICTVWCPLSVIGQEAPGDSIYYRSHRAMGTTFGLYVGAESEARASELFGLSFEEIDRVESILSDYRPESELSRINRTAAHTDVVTDPEVFGFLSRSLGHSRRTNGAFDMTVGALMDAWGFPGDRDSFPPDSILNRALENTGYQKVILDIATRSVSFSAPALRLDPGANGKGYTLDRVHRLLADLGVTSALLDAGQSSYYAIGSPDGGHGWPVNITHPSDSTLVVTTVMLKDAGLATSGSYGKVVVLGGHTYGHIIDPRTGRPVPDMVQVTAVARSAEEADVLSTALFVAGSRAARNILSSYSESSAILLFRRHGLIAEERFNWYY